MLPHPLLLEGHGNHIDIGGSLDPSREACEVSLWPPGTAGSLPRAQDQERNKSQEHLNSTKEKCSIIALHLGCKYLQWHCIWENWHPEPRPFHCCSSGRHHEHCHWNEAQDKRDENRLYIQTVLIPFILSFVPVAMLMVSSWGTAMEWTWFWMPVLSDTMSLEVFAS